MTYDITTTDFADFGAREREMVVELLQAWREQGLPSDFYEDKVQPMMNRHSGNVFLTNSEFQVAMMNGDKLESFYSCPNCGNEAFKEDQGLSWHDDHPECRRFMREIGVELNDEDDED